MMPLVSVVMAAKNYARYLPMAVRSVQSQSFPNWELLIVDDGSSDGTQEAVKPFLKDARIRYVASDRLGQSRAKNLGLRLARGEFIAFLDADDAWLSTKLMKQLAAMQIHQHAGVVACERILIDENAMTSPQRQQGRSVSPLLALRACNKTLDDIYISNPICFSSVLVRRQVFEHVGAFNEDLDLSIDYDLWLRVAANYEIACLPEKLVLYRTGHGNLSKRQSDRIATAFTIMERASRRDLPVSKAAVHEGYASTHRSLGWLYRRAAPRLAIRAYGNALRWPNRRIVSLKGLIATAAHSLRRSREPLAPENQPLNS